MPTPSSTKTEHRAINALETIIDKHPTMEHQFNSCDKEMSWDGYIYLPKKNDGTQSKRNFKSRVPVQIKGRNDPSHKFLNKEKIPYPVDLDDLNAYATEKGVLYFLVFMDCNQTEIFYASLYPSKIAYYLEAAQNKGNSRNYRIPFFKLEQDAQQLYIIAKQFDKEAQQQGTANNPLVQDRIKSKEFGRIKSVTFTVVGAEDLNSALLRLPSEDICLYGKTENDKYLRPIDWFGKPAFCIGKDVNQEISLGEEVYYTQYKCIIDSNGGKFLAVSPNLRIRVTDNKFDFNFKIQSSLKEASLDARFLLGLKSTNSIVVDGHCFQLENLDISSEFEEELRIIVDLFETLKMIDFDMNFKLSDCTDKQKMQLIKLVDLRLGKYNSQIQNKLSSYIWEFGDKFVPLIISKKDNEIELINSMYANNFEFFEQYDESSNKKWYHVPTFAYYDVDVLANLYYYDYDAFRSQIDNADINKITSGTLLECMLILINVFDYNSDSHFLVLAEYLLQLLEPFVTEELILLNRLQIKKRTGELNKNDLKILKGIDSEDIHILFGKHVLLGNKTKAQEYYEQFSENDQSMYKKFPIYKLYDQL